MKKSSIAVMIGPTTLFGSKPYLKAIIFKKVEHGTDIESVNKIEITGRKNNVVIVNDNPIRNAFSNIAAIPIMLDVANDNVNVANMFSDQDLKLNSPIIRSREVLAIKGPLIFPRIDNKAGIMRMRMGKLSKFKIKIDNMTPARRSPMMETISEGNTSLIIFPLVSCCSIYHHHQYLKI